jgi:ATP-binding cassette subfamily B protein
MQSNSKKSSFNFSLLGRVLLFVKPYRAVFYGSILLAILMAFFAPVRPYLIQLTVDEVTGKHPHIPQWVHWFTGNSALQSFTGFIIAITIFQIIFLLIETIVRFIFTFLTAWLGQHVVKDLRVTVYNKILHLNLTQFDKTPIGTLTTRTINDIESINDIFSDGLIPILADLLTILITLATMFWIDWRLTLVALIPFPILIIATYYFKEAVNKSFIRVRNAVAALNAFVQEHITGMQVVQSFAVEDKEFEKFKHINREHRNANIKAIFAYSVFFPSVEIVLALSSALIIWWVANRAIAFTGGTPVNFSGKIVSFVLFMNQIFRPLRVIADKFNVLQMGMVAAERVFKVLDNTDVTQNTGKHDPDTIQGKIDFKHVWFAYIDEQYVLKDIDFSINAGETVAIVGHTGSGKTSIASLMNRLYHIQKGSILIDDVKIEDYSTEALRKHIGVVLQDVFLFSGSIIDNITLHNPAITR